MASRTGVFTLGIMTALLLSVFAIPAKAVQTTHDDSHIHFAAFESPSRNF